jgi:hypothetical protein
MKKRVLLVGLILALVLTVAIPVSIVWSAGTDTVECTVTAELISLSVSSGVVNYGVLGTNDTQNTQSLDPIGTQIITNDGTVNEDFSIMCGDAIGGTKNWTLGATNGLDQFYHMFSTNNDFGTNYLTGSYQTFVTDIAPTGHQDLDLLIGMPTSVTDSSQKTISVSIQASAHTP